MVNCIPISSIKSRQILKVHKMISRILKLSLTATFAVGLGFSMVGCKTRALNSGLRSENRTSNRDSEHNPFQGEMNITDSLNLLGDFYSKPDTTIEERYKLINQWQANEIAHLDKSLDSFPIDIDIFVKLHMFFSSDLIENLDKQRKQCMKTFYSTMHSNSGVKMLYLDSTSPRSNNDDLRVSAALSHWEALEIDSFGFLDFLNNPMVSEHLTAVMQAEPSYCNLSQDAGQEILKQLSYLQKHAPKDKWSKEDLQIGNWQENTTWRRNAFLRPTGMLVFLFKFPQHLFVW